MVMPIPYIFIPPQKTNSGPMIGTGGAQESGPSKMIREWWQRKPIKQEEFTIQSRVQSIWIKVQFPHYSLINIPR